jgi:hypothetical protein
MTPRVGSPTTHDEKDSSMHRNGSDADLLAMAAQHLDTDAEALLRRYYGSPDDVRHELDELDRTGRLQPSLAQLLRLELGRSENPAE